MELPSALNLARFQFAFTIVWHFLFPALTIGLASYLAVLEALWLATGDNRYIEVTGTGSVSSRWPSRWVSCPAS